MVASYNRLRITGLARGSKPIHLKYEHSAQNPLCGHCEAVVLQSKTTSFSVRKQHSDDDLDDGPFHESETSSTTAFYGEVEDLKTHQCKTLLSINHQVKINKWHLSVLLQMSLI